MGRHPNPEGRIFLGVNLSRDLYGEIKALAIEDGRTVADFVRRHLEKIAAAKRKGLKNGRE